MPAIPLPFVITLLLGILLVRVLVEGRALWKPVAIFISTCILMMIAVGLRWTVDFAWVRFLQPVIAALLPPVAWLCFSRLRQVSAVRFWPHFLLPALVLVFSATWHLWQPPIDFILAVLYFGYGVALLRSASTGTDHLDAVRFSDTDGTRKAIFAIGGLLLFSAVIDLIIAGDFNFYRGDHAAFIVTIANILVLPVVAYAIAVIGRSVPDYDNREGEIINIIPNSAEDQTTMQMIDLAMTSKQLYRDPDLTLSRLSRRLGVPSRQISTAINRIHGRNVSQVVNEYRISEAQRLLIETELPITTVMFECGFQTKSNFNREFSRVTGTTPSDYRRLGAKA